jgi:hypothetical protein
MTPGWIERRSAVDDLGGGAVWLIRPMKELLQEFADKGLCSLCRE